MPSLLAIYTCPIADVLQQWNEAASQLGLELNRPLVDDGEHWDARLDGETISLTVSTLSEWDLMPGCGGSVWVDVWGVSYDQSTEMFYKVLELSLKAREVLSIFDKDCVFCFATYALPDTTPEQLVEHYDGEYVTEGFHSLRAFHRDLVGDPERWRAEAHERGVVWKELGEYGVLDVHWDQRGQWRKDSSTDLLTGVRSEHAIFDHLPLDPFPPHLTSPEESLPERAACGTVFVVRILEVAPNPTREPEPWREVSIRTARILERLTSSDVILGRWNSIRSFALVCPGLMKNGRAPLLKTIRDELTNGFDDTIYCARGRIDMASWPADGDTQSIIWDYLQDLESRADGTPFGTPEGPTTRSSTRLL